MNEGSAIRELPSPKDLPTNTDIEATLTKLTKAFDCQTEAYMRWETVVGNAAKPRELSIQKKETKTLIAVLCSFF